MYILEMKAVNDKIQEITIIQNGQMRDKKTKLISLLDESLELIRKSTFNK